MKKDLRPYNSSTENNDLNNGPEGNVNKQIKEDIKTTFEQEKMACSPQYIAKKVMEVNPDVEMKFGKTSQTLYSSANGENLVAPDDYIYNEKNGFTNKHNTKSGLYGQLPVRPLENYDPWYEEY